MLVGAEDTTDYDHQYFMGLHTLVVGTIRK
jgi:hypothetical protein